MSHLPILLILRSLTDAFSPLLAHFGGQKKPKPMVNLRMNSRIFTPPRGSERVAWERLAARVWKNG
jgi:hypothetical protein